MDIRRIVHPPLQARLRFAEIPTAVAEGPGHRLALFANGRVRAWGDNRCGQLGTGLETDDPGQFYPPEPVIGLPDVAAIGVVESTSFALDKSRYLWVWGWTAIFGP